MRKDSAEEAGIAKNLPTEGRCARSCREPAQRRVCFVGLHSDTLIFGAVWIAAFQILIFLKEKLEIKVYKIATIKKSF